MTHNQVSKIIINEAFYVHRKLGPGLLESAYSHCLEYRLTEAGLYVKREQPIPVIFDSIKLDCGYRADLIINNMVLIEVKAVESVMDLHLAQTLTYLKFLNLKLGILLNFNTILLKDGIRRIVNGL